MKHIIPETNGFYWFKFKDNEWEPVECHNGNEVYVIGRDDARTQKDFSPETCQFGPRIEYPSTP